MSSSADEQKDIRKTDSADVPRGSILRRLALTIGATGLPVAVFAHMQNLPELAFGALGATAAATLAFSAMTFDFGRSARSKTRQQADAFEMLVDYVRDTVLQFDVKGELVFASASAETLFGCETYELRGPGLPDRAHVLDRPLYLTAFADAQHSGKERIIEVRMRRDSETPGVSVPTFVWMEVNLSPVKPKGATAGPYGVIALVRDISQRKDDENRMREAQKAAESASYAKSQFLAVIGHELRTPLNAIVGFSDMMLNDIGGKLTPTHNEYAGHIRDSGRHLLEVVNMLLDMSKIEAGRFELRTERFEPQSLVAPCIQIVTKAAQEKNVELEVNVPKQLPEILGDERACRQMVINLLSNAIKFTEPGGRVTWSLKQMGKSLALTISDTGIGMSADVVARLGEPFFQAESNAERRFEGTGLGISIVKGLVDLHDGSVKITSAPGEGTNITVLLPLDGPQTNRSNRITVLRPDVAEQPNKDWPEQKRMTR